MTCAAPRRAQHLRGGEQRGAAGHHVVDQHDAPAAHGGRAQRLERERAAQVAQPLARACRPLCARRLARAQQQAPRRSCAGASRRASSCAWLKPRSRSRARRERHRQHQVGLLQRRLDPGRAAHQRRDSGAAQPASPRNLNCAMQSRPGPGVGAGGQAGVERRRVPQAVAALARRRPARGSAQVAQRGAGGAKRATQASHTGRAGQARQTAHWLGRRSSKAAKRRASQAAEHGSIYWRAHAAPTPHSARRPSTPTAAAAGRGSAPAPARPGCTRRSAGAWKTGCSGSRPQPRSWADWCAAARRHRGARAGRAALPRRAVASWSSPKPALAARTAEALAAPWWTPRRWQGAQPSFDAPPEDGVDLLWANMALHMAADPQALIAPLASRRRDRRLPDVLLPRARHAARAARAVPRAWAGRRPAMSSPTCTTGATCWCTPASPSR